jgi:signal transduction histidine kinase
MRSLSRLNLLNLAAFLTIAGSAVSGVLQIDRILQRWLVLFLLLFLGFLQSRLPVEVESPQQLRLTNSLVAVQALIVTYLVWSTGLGFSFLVLFFILTVNAALYNSLRGTLLWVAVFTALTALLQFQSGGWSGLLRDVAVYAGGFLFFGFVTNALNVARRTQVQNERLLAELRAKNRQLEEFSRQVESLTAVEERNRLAREVHDTLGHHLTTSSVQLEAAQKLLVSNPAKAAEMVGGARGQVREALSELRQTVGRLREPLEIELSLPKALSRLAQDFQSATGLVVHLELAEPPCPVTPSQRLALYRAAQEGLTNVHRHSSAPQAWVRLICHPESIHLEVQDDGVGIQLDRDSQPGGFGLMGLKERAALLGGNLQVSRFPGGGTLLRMSLPYSGQNNLAK